MNDYARIAKVIAYIDSVHPAQPSLKELARHLRLGESQFHRLFTKWAGVTPKAFLRCLTHSHARELLAQGKSVLDTALDAGLSGPGRLHDLCIDLEAATPGEIKSGGEGWTIRYGFTDSPFGTALIAENERGICHLSFVEEGKKQESLKALKTTWPKAQLKQSQQRIDTLAGSIFTSPNETPQQVLKAFVQGTPMQVKVWQALLKIPPGQLTTYGELATGIGQPNAARAVGSAVGSNPIGYLIPCHRVIRKTGLVSGYRWGTDRKRMILARESAIHTSLQS